MNFTYPVPDIVEQWAGAFQEGTSDKVWAAGYTSTGLYVYTHGKRMQGQSGRIEDLGSRAAAQTRFDSMVHQKIHNRGYRECGFDRPGTMVRSFSGNVAPEVRPVTPNQVLVGRTTPRPAARPRTVRRPRTLEWKDPTNLDSWEAASLQILGANAMEAIVCPLCHSATLRQFFLRRPQAPGQYWIWCPTCATYESGSSAVPSWWVDFPGTTQLTPIPVWLDANYAQIYDHLIEGAVPIPVPA